MQAVILAGGLGTRLRPLTYDTPKPLIPISGKPFLDYVIELLKNKGITDIIICSSYLAGKIKEYYMSRNKFGVRITHITEITPLGTAGAIKNAAAYLDNVFFVINGDTYLDIDYAALYNEFLKTEKIGLMVVYTGEETWERQNDTLIEGNKVVAYSKDGSDPRVKYVFAGVLLFRKSILNYIRSGVAITLEKEIFPTLIEKGELLAHETKVRYYDIGTLERMKKFEEFIAQKQKGKNDNK